MRATGIVRRIDDLGRVVIPKEIRRTMRIREGDPLEIFTDAGGEVVFKKYSPVGELSDFAGQYADVMSRACGMPVLICDRDHIIAAAGLAKKEMLQRPISASLEELMESRRLHTVPHDHFVPPIEDAARGVTVCAPILSAGDMIGAVCLLQNEQGSAPNEGDVKLAQVAASFLGKQMEE